MALKARAEAVTEALGVGVITVSQIEATHAQRRYTTLLEEFDRQVGLRAGLTLR